MHKPAAHRKNSTTRKLTYSKVRIVGGEWRGRQLEFVDVDGLRPTKDALRETLFNWLAFDINNIEVLDLFAGTGALGFESISRGARKATLIERNNTAVMMLQKSQQLLGEKAISSVQIINQDALSFLNNANTNCTPDLIWLDPPFSDNLLQPCIDLLQQQHWLNSSPLLYVEMPKREQISIPTNWSLLKQKKMGGVNAQLWQTKP